MEDDKLNPTPNSPDLAKQSDLFLPRLRLSDIVKVIAVLIVMSLITLFIFSSIAYAINNGEIKQLRAELDSTPQEAYLICCDIDSGEYLVLSEFDPYRSVYIPETLPANSDEIEAAFPLCHTNLKGAYSYSMSMPLPEIKGYEYVADAIEAQAQDEHTDSRRINIYIDKDGIYLILHYRKITS